MSESPGIRRRCTSILASIVIPQAAVEVANGSDYIARAVRTNQLWRLLVHLVPLIDV